MNNITLSNNYYKTITINGLNFNVYDEGDSTEPAILFLHGQPASSEEFRFNVPAFREAGYRVIIPDLLGAGGSDRPTDLSLYTGAKDYEHILGIVDALNIEQFDIVFGDRGSIPGWMITALNPNRVRRAISENVSHLNGFFTSGLEQHRRSWYMYFFQFDAAEAALRADDWALFRAWMEHHPDVNQWIPLLERDNGLNGAVLNWYRANMNPDQQAAEEPLPDVNQPVLLLYTMNDTYIGPEQLATGNRHIKGPLIMKRIEGAGHFIARNAPDIFNREVLAFLQQDFS